MFCELLDYASLVMCDSVLMFPKEGFALDLGVFYGGSKAAEAPRKWESTDQKGHFTISTRQSI